MSLDVNLSEPEEFDSFELHSVLKEVARIKKINDFNYHVDCIGGKGESYIANTFRVVIRESNNEENNFKVIVKTLVNTSRQEIFHDLHKREVSAYKEIVTEFNKIQKDNENKVVLPECLLSSAEKGNEIIILEDLNEDGWETDKTFKNFEELSYDQVSMVVSELAKFHGLSFVFRNQNPMKFAELKSQFEDVLFEEKFLNKSKLKSYFQESFEASLKYIVDDEVRNKLKGVTPKLIEILKKYVKANKYNVFCHGDCWINNMLFKYENNKPTGVCFLDFQVVRYACPVLDLIHFLYLCTTTKFRSEYFDKTKTVYYDTLTSTLSNYGLDVNTIYPLHDFENDVKETLPYGLIIALLELKLVTLTPEDDAILKGAHVDHETELIKVPGENRLLEIRINEVVNECVADGVLDKLLSKL